MLWVLMVWWSLETGSLSHLAEFGRRHNLALVPLSRPAAAFPRHSGANRARIPGDSPTLMRIAANIHLWQRQETGGDSFDVAVGMPVARHPPRRSIRAEFPHTAPILDEWRQNERRETDAECVVGEANGRTEDRFAPMVTPTLAAMAKEADQWSALSRIRCGLRLRFWPTSRTA